MKRIVLWILAVAVPLSGIGLLVFSTWIHPPPAIALFGFFLVPSLALDLVVERNSSAFWVLFCAGQFLYFGCIVSLIAWAASAFSTRGTDD